VVSPLLSNIYLDPLDQQMAKQGYEMIRYADDRAPRAQRAEEGPMCVTA
jgi:retron-type reverse transcriptase